LERKEREESPVGKRMLSPGGGGRTSNSFSGAHLRAGTKSVVFKKEKRGKPAWEKELLGPVGKSTSVPHEAPVVKKGRKRVLRKGGGQMWSVERKIFPSQRILLQKKNKGKKEKRGQRKKGETTIVREDGSREQREGEPPKGGDAQRRKKITQGKGRRGTLVQRETSSEEGGASPGRISREERKKKGATTQCKEGTANDRERIGHHPGQEINRL